MRKSISLIVDCADDLPDPLLAGVCIGLLHKDLPDRLPSVKLVKIRMSGEDYEVPA